jgi:PAS domain S-box-containing protein
MEAHARDRFKVFLLISGLLIAGVVVVSGLIVGWFFEDHVLVHEEEHVAEIVKSQAYQHLSPSVFESQAAARAAAPLFRTFLEGLPGVFRLKVWDGTGTIVWSDEPKLIGMTFADDPYVARAFKGRVTTTIGTPSKRENIYEADTPYVAEVYVPITWAGTERVLAVIETYRDTTVVMRRVEAVQRQILAIGGVGGLFLYAALALVVWKASASERRAISQLAEQNRELVSLEQFARSVLRPLNVDQAAASVVEKSGEGLGLDRAALYRLDTDGDLVPLAVWPKQQTAWPPPVLTREALEMRTRVVRGRVVAIPLFTRTGAAHLFVGEWGSARSEPDDAILRMLDIMLHEAAIVLTNVELFTEIKEAHARLDAILASATDRMVILDRDLRVVWMNSSAAATSKRNPVGETCFEVFHNLREVCDGCPAARSLHTGRVERGVRARTQADGRVIYLDVVTVPLHGGSDEPNQVLEVARDVTALVETQQRLKDANEALLRAQAHVVENERLAAVGQVIVSLHHEILNPLAGILAALQVLKDGLVSPDQVHAVAEAEAEARKVERLVRRLADLRRADQAPYVGSTTMLNLEAFTNASGPPST